ncbi:hypothetical protein Droror1_Dr00022617 [Drosera rotundifolia]
MKTCRKMPWTWSKIRMLHPWKIEKKLNNKTLMLGELAKKAQKEVEDQGAKGDKYLRRLNTYRQKRFSGKGNPTNLEDWLRDFEKLLDAVQSPDNLRITFTSYYLEGKDDAWWSTGEERAEGEGFGWVNFKAVIRDRFYSESLQTEKRNEFLNLKQETMIVLEYASQFMNLLRF